MTRTRCHIHGDVLLQRIGVLNGVGMVIVSLQSVPKCAARSPGRTLRQREDFTLREPGVRGEHANCGWQSNPRASMGSKGPALSAKSSAHRLRAHRGGAFTSRATPETKKLALDRAGLRERGVEIGSAASFPRL